MRPQVSAIVPVYNVEKYLERCVNSLVNQTLQNIEIILVDDGSFDNSPHLCDLYAEKYNNIQVIHKKNAGLGMARNSGIEIAKGEFVAFVDSDDYVELNAFETLYKAASLNQADTCLCGFKRLYNSGKIVDNPQPFGNLVVEENKNIKQNILLNMIGSPSNYYNDIFLLMAVWMGIYSLDLIEKNKLRFCSERELISEDLIFDIDYYTFAEKVVLVEDLLYVYCENEGSLTLSYKADRYEKEITLFREIQKKCELINLDIGDRYKRSFLGRARLCIYSEVKHQKFTLCLANIKKICNDEYLIKILQEYNFSRLPLKHVIFFVLMKLKCTFLIYCIIRAIKC